MLRAWFAALLLGLLLTGCVSLRTDVPRTASHALPPDPAVPLGQLARRITPAQAPAAFRLLEAGHDALAARLALAAQARQSLDLQYYIFRGDASGKLIVQALLAAADRGVRVRALLDDMYTAENEAAIRALDVHPNIQIRLYNPFRYRMGGLVRGLEYLADRERLNRRMHNKLFLADNQMGITGGRNIGDEYFQLDEALAFRDLDVLAAGQVVQALSAAFDDYWNSPLAVPAEALPDQPAGSGDDLRDALDAFYTEVGRILVEQLGSDLLRPEPGTDRSWHAGQAELVLDRPEKTSGGRAAAADLPVSKLLRASQAARRELLIASPYLVPGRWGSDLLRQLRDKGLKIRILTNSLAANDVLLVHAGYARYRLPMLQSGLELYELKPVKEQPRLRLTAGSRSSRASLHSKALVFDRQRVYIGSMNLDPRSVLLNTEVGLLIDSPTLASQVAGFIEATMMPEQSYRVRLDPDGPADEPRLNWLERRGGEERRHIVEPATDLWLRAFVEVLSALPIEEDL
jgi:putative cardiolipin synthase